MTQTASVPFPGSFLVGLAGADEKLWTIDHESGHLRRIDADSLRPEDMAKIAHHPISLAVGKDAVWVGTQPQKFR